MLLSLSRIRVQMFGISSKLSCVMGFGVCGGNVCRLLGVNGVVVRHQFQY